MLNFKKLLSGTVCYLLFTTGMLFTQEVSKPMVAIFHQTQFPYYMANEAVSPKVVSDILKEIGIESQLLTAEQLADTKNI